MKKALISITLYLIAWALTPVLEFISVVHVLYKGGSLSGYFMSTAIELDKYGNRNYRTLFNDTLRKPEGAEFGAYNETISSVIGKNKRDNTLTGAGRALSWILDKLDKNHSLKSIKKEPNGDTYSTRKQPLLRLAKRN